MNRYPDLSFDNIIRKGAHILDLEVPPVCFDQFRIYHQILNTWNEKHNLTSLFTPLDIAILHFLDSLTLIKLIPPACSRVLDIGSGAGFPGLVLKIAVPQLHITLLDKNTKKLVFLKNVVYALGLSHVTFIDRDIVNVLTSDDMSTYDVVVTRALSLAEPVVNLLAHKLAPYASIIRMLGPASFGHHLPPYFFLPRAVWAGYLPFISAYRKLIRYSLNVLQK